MEIRRIRPEDNKKVEDLIRFCLVEFGGDHEGCAWTDPDLGRFYELYDQPERAYWVAVEGDRVLGGVGIGPLDGVEGVCELQKMYTYPEVRGSGLAQNMIDLAHEFAGQYYKQCYLETFDNMLAAQRFYQKNGYAYVDKPLGSTGHFTCEVRMLKDLF